MHNNDLESQRLLSSIAKSTEKDLFSERYGSTLFNRENIAYSIDDSQFEPLSHSISIINHNHPSLQSFHTYNNQLPRILSSDEAENKNSDGKSDSNNNMLSNSNNNRSSDSFDHFPFNNSTVFHEPVHDLHIPQPPSTHPSFADKIKQVHSVMDLSNHNHNNLLDTYSFGQHNIHKNDLNSLPSSYTAQDGHFAARDAYLDTLKFQFFGLGFSFGSSIQMFVMSLVIMFISTSSNSGPIKELSHEYYSVFRGVFLLCWFFILYGVSIFIWRRVKVEYSSILHVSYYHTYQFVLRGSNSISYIIFICLMLYIFTITGGLDGGIIERETLKHIWPALAFFIPLIIFICPLDYLTEPFFGVKLNSFNQRWCLLQEIGAVFLSPFSQVKFHRILIADILCSMPKVFPDLQYTFCIYLTGSFWDNNINLQNDDSKLHAYNICGSGSNIYTIIQFILGLLPFHIRFWQCIRIYFETGNTLQLFNALKYCLALAVSILATIRSYYSNSQSMESMQTVLLLEHMWLFLGVIATIYSYLWDVFIDWGLGDILPQTKHFLLRPDIHFEPMTYYFAMIMNFFMRLGWAFVISPQQHYIKQHFILILAAIEIVRRVVWVVIRVEWEHTKHQNAIKTKVIKN
eukprot:gene12138-16250_t